MHIVSAGLRAAAVSAAVIFSCAACAAEEKTIDESWFGLYMMGSKIGWSHDRVIERTEGGRKVFISDSESETAINRMNTVIAGREASRVVEDEKGELVSFEHYEKQSTDAKTMKGSLDGGKIVWTVDIGSGGKTSRSTGWIAGRLCPWALQKLTRSKGLEKGASIDVPIFMASAPESDARISIEMKGPEETGVLGRRRTLARCDQTLKMRGTTLRLKTWVSNEWITWKIDYAGFMEMIRMPKEAAIAEGEAKEIFLKLAVEPDGRITGARTLRRLRLRLDLEGEGLEELPSGLGQKVVEKGEGYAVIEITVPEIKPAAGIPVKAEGMEPFLASSSYLAAKDPAIMEIALKVAGSEQDSLAAARLLERWVFENIKKKNFGVGFATASEVARNLEGDCSEHAVLLAALCRAARIPSRVVSGLVFADSLATSRGSSGAFGFHMWTEVFVGEWIALDATIGAGFADATHVALARSALESESSVFDLTPIAAYLGKLKIKVIE